MPRLTAALLCVLIPTAVCAEPLKLHPDNPHYFHFRGKPTVLITSGEHYGAVLNRDFNYVAYLDELKAHRLNLTRTFSGTYVEIPSSFGIEDNTLAPLNDKYLGPWARTDKPGAGDGGNKFDLAAWNPAYFERLRDFVARAEERGVVVEFVLFCTIYDDKLWAVNPMNPRNNVNDIEPVGREQFFTPKNTKLLAFHDAFVRKITAELKDFDNVYYEICNEPYFNNVRLEWQHHIADTIADAESKFPHRHLIAQNIANGQAKIEKPHPNVSIFNFHYASPPDTVALNDALRKPLGDDETGFKGTGDSVYRAEAWDFLIAGGALYNNLDYSFTPKHPAGTFKNTRSPGGGSLALRKQLRILKEFLEELDFLKMAPHNEVIKSGIPAQATARCLAQPGEAYAIYIRGGAQAKLTLDLPQGDYQAAWIDTRTGERTMVSLVGSTVESPRYTEDIALRIRKK